MPTKFGPQVPCDATIRHPILAYSKIRRWLQVPNKVFVVNDSGHDLTSAKCFGEIVIMSSGTINKFRVSKIFREFEKYISSSSPNDFILQSGPNITCTVASSMFAAKHGRINLLIWRIGESGEESYVVRRLNFKQGKERR